ncbi:MAG: TonB family protein [Deltaproteobacteria bacterium]|nr:TonB family protein [Deltaproteobacteria bacterium]
MLHLLGATVFLGVAPLFPQPEPPPRPPRAVSLVILPPPEPVPPEEEPEPEKPELAGQIVETPPPLEEVTPKEADYLAEHDNAVEKETRTEQFKVNPEVLAPTFSREEQVSEQGENVEDLDMKEPSSGATVGNHRFDPDRDGTLASVPSPWDKTNKPGTEAPAMFSSSSDQEAMGAPQNDRLDEEIGDRLALNTKEYLYAGYLKRIRRLVNFYWSQNLDNLPSSARLTRTGYDTTVEVILNADGALEFIEVVEKSGSGELDHAVVSAFQIAGPFPNPPEGLVEKDGRVYLPTMSFEVQLGVAAPNYQGIDPRAGVQFPGILKSPR